MTIIEKLNEFSKKNKKVKAFLDMDGTIVEFIFDLEESYAKRGGYLEKKPVKPIIDKIRELNDRYKNIEITILSCSKNEEMTKEKNIWLDNNVPFIKRDRRIFINEGCIEDINLKRNRIKAEYIKEHVLDDEIAVLIDDDIRILIESQIMLRDKIIPIHVTSLLI